MKDMKKWFGKWDASHLLHDALVGAFVNEVFFAMQMYHNLGKAWRHIFHIELQVLHQPTKP